MSAAAAVETLRVPRSLAMACECLLAPTPCTLDQIDALIHSNLAPLGRLIPAAIIEEMDISGPAARAESWWRQGQQVARSVMAGIDELADPDGEPEAGPSKRKC